MVERSADNASFREVGHAMRRAIEGGEPRLVAEQCALKNATETDLIYGLTFLVSKGEEGDRSAWGALKAVALLREEFDVGKQCRFAGYDVFRVPKEYLATKALIAAGAKASFIGEGEFVETFRQIVSAGYPEELVGGSWLRAYEGKSMEYFFNLMFGLAAENEWFSLFGTMLKESRDAGMAVPALNAAADAVNNALIKAKKNGDLVATGKLLPLLSALNAECIEAMEAEIEGALERKGA